MSAQRVLSPGEIPPEERVLSPGEVPAEPPLAEQQPPAWEQNLNIHLICPECQEVPPNLVEEFSSGDTVCASCGLVLSGRIVDTRSEWRTFSNDDQGNDDPSRVGDAANPLLNGSQLATNISFDQGGGKHRELHRAQSKATNDKATKQLLLAYKQIGALCDAKQMQSKVADAAKHLYKMADDARLFKGKPQDVVIAGCIFMACRQVGSARTFKELNGMTNVQKKDIGRVFKVLEKFMKKQRAVGPTVSVGGGVQITEYDATASTNPEELCRRYCNRLKVSKFTANIAEELVRRQTQKGIIDGRSPLSVASACILMITNLMGEAKTPKQIAVEAKVSDSTIRGAYKELLKHKDELIDPAWIEKGGDITRLPAS